MKSDNHHDQKLSKNFEMKANNSKSMSAPTVPRACENSRAALQNLENTTVSSFPAASIEFSCMPSAPPISASWWYGCWCNASVRRGDRGGDEAGERRGEGVADDAADDEEAKP